MLQKCGQIIVSTVWEGCLPRPSPCASHGKILAHFRNLGQLIFSNSEIATDEQKWLLPPWNDLFMSLILARSRSQADLLYCSRFFSSSNRFAPVLPWPEKLYNFKWAWLINYRVIHLVVDLGWLTLIWEFHHLAHPLLPSAHQPRQNWADSGTCKIQVNQTQPGPRPDESTCTSVNIVSVCTSSHAMGSAPGRETY